MEKENLAGYRRFVAYVYEYPDGKKGNGKGFIKVEARDGKCRMNYRIQGIYGKEEAPCKIYGFVRKSDGCEGIYLGECDLAGDTVQFQTEVPDQGLGGTAYGLNDLSGLVMLTGDGIMYGTGWDDRPVRLEEIRLPRMQEDRSRNADRAPETNNNMQKEELETGPEAVQDELPEGVAAAEALMEAEEPVTLDDEEGSLPLAEHSEETVNLFSGESPDDNLEEMDYRTDTTVEVETDSTDAGRAERGNTMEGNRAEAGNVMEGNRAEAGNAMERNRAETGNAMEGNRADGNNAMGGNRTERENAMEADWEAGNNAVGGNRAERENAIEADWEAGNNAVDGNRAGRNNSMDDTPWQGRYPSNTFRQGGMNTPDRNREERSNFSNAGHRDWGYPPVIGRDNETSAPDRRMEENRSNESSETEEGRQAMPSRTEGDPYMPPRINERGTYFPQHYEEDEPETGQEERSEQRMEPVAPSRTENTVQPVMEPSRSDMGQNRNTAIPNMGQNRNTAVPNMDQDRNAAMPDMNQNRNAAVPNMGQDRNTTMPDINQNRNTTMPDMNQNRNTAMPDTDRNPDTTAPDMERPPYTEEELYRETIDHEIFGRDQYPDSEMRIEASGSTDAAEQSTWNPAGDREEDAVNLLEELDQDEDAIRNMRQMEKEVTEKTVQSPEEGELHGQSAQAARQPAVFAPFSDGEIVDCRQITPAELRILARRDRGLMNNNFLRHGYYRYHYLLLGRRRDDGRYILGVPGVYDRQECLMAGMFGFPNFKAAKTQGKAAMPRFGYWYRLIDTPDINRRNRS